MKQIKERARRLISNISQLTEAQVHWLERAVAVFKQPHQYERFSSDLISDDILNDFGDGLGVHHCFSLEPFSKDKFEVSSGTNVIW